MYCDEKKVKEIITQMTRLYNELLEAKSSLEEKKQVLSSLTKGHTDTNINNINYRLEDAVERVRLLIIELETKSTSILTLDNLKGDTINKTLPGTVSGINTTITSQRFAMAVSEEEALNAIATNLKNNREITKLINAEIGKGKAVLR